MSYGSKPHKPKDARPWVTLAIWGCATGMLVISIPLVYFTASSVIPLVILCGAALGTVAVWVSGSGEPRASNDGKRLRELEERLSNLETINNFERRLAAEAAARQETLVRQNAASPATRDGSLSAPGARSEGEPQRSESTPIL